MDQEDMHNLAENLYLYRMQHDLGLVPFSIRAGIAHSNLRKGGDTNGCGNVRQLSPECV